jgi:D-3-phosphoglycerate dehydrogenase / 2-oxoglutarate reductase
VTAAVHRLPGTRARVLVAERLAPEGVALLAADHDVDELVGVPRSELLAALPDYDALLVRSQVQVDAELIAAGSRLVIIGRAGVGVDNVDVAAASAAGIVVINAPTGNTIAATEHTLALLMALARHIPAADASMRRGEWQRARFTGRELRGQTLGIIGLGKIGMAVADRARGLEMDIIGHDPFVTEEAAMLHGIRLTTVADLLATADAVTVHVPLTPKTRGMIGAAELATMKPTALLVNVARGGVIDEADLAAALHAGTIGGAAVDVYAAEPPGADDPLLTAPRTILTPHLGASTAEAQTRVAVEACEQVVDVLAGRSPRSAVNAPMLTPETAQALAPYLPLARTLGQFYARFAPDLSDLTLEVAGELASHDATPLVAATLGGLLERDIEDRITVVNAAAIAKARGIVLAERKTPDAGRYASLLTLSGPVTAVGGTIATTEPRIVRLDEHWLDVPVARHMLVTRHQDRPGTMGLVGRVLGESDVNISAMYLARTEARSDAFMILALDDAVPAAAAAAILAQDAVLDLWLIDLD